LDQFREAASHGRELDNRASSYAHELARFLVDRPKLLKRKEKQIALRALSVEQLEVVARHLIAAMESGASSWNTIVGPLIKDSWPKDKAHHSPKIATQFALIAIKAGTEFPTAVESLLFLISVSDDLHSVIESLRESGHCTAFPEVSLRFLDQVVQTQAGPIFVGWEFLEAIAEAAPSLRDDPRMVRLRDYASSH
jgi:hypothetical protein